LCLLSTSPAVQRSYGRQLPTAIYSYYQNIAGLDTYGATLNQPLQDNVRQQPLTLRFLSSINRFIFNNVRWNDRHGDAATGQTSVAAFLP